MISYQAQEEAALRNDLAFAYRLWRPAHASGDTLVLLHGSGVDETTMAPLAAEIAPDALRIAVRGRIPQEDGWRWFGRITPTSFEQASIRSEAVAFVEFIGELARIHDLDLTRTVFLGYSNGANVISSVMLLHPGVIRRAALLRAMPVLDDVPSADLSGMQLLVIAGRRDVTYSPFTPALVALLRTHGAAVDVRTVDAGHEFGTADVALVREWLVRMAPPVT